MSGRPCKRDAGYSLIELLLVMLLLCLFAITVATLVQSGARAYSAIGGNMERASDARTAMSYINVRLKQNDAQGALRIERVDGSDALVVREQFEGIDEAYYTWIYCVDGALLEAPLLLEDERPDPSRSEHIAAVDGFTLAYDKATGLLTYTIRYTRDVQGSTVNMETAASALLKAGDVSDLR